MTTEIRFSQQFSAWLTRTGLTENPFSSSDFVVFDANALLALYRIEPSARQQVIDILRAIRDQIWIPHQVALEFVRNREKAAQGRHSSLTKAKVAVQNAEKDALEGLQSAITAVTKFRDESMTQREWDLRAVKLDQESLERRLKGAMQPALDELTALKDEQDASLRNLADQDPVIITLDPILTGRVGPHYDTAKMRQLVDEAVNFRFPNKIPPGYRDIRKETDLKSAGDYLLWSQILEKVAANNAIDRVVLVTNDVKPDWWHVDPNGNPIGPHQELIQELRDVGDADLVMLTLADFVTTIPSNLAPEVSTETVDQIRKSQPAPIVLDIEIANHATWDFDSMSPLQFDELVVTLLERMNFEDISSPEDGPDAGFDYTATREDDDGRDEKFAIEVKKNRNPVQSSTVRSLITSMDRHEIERGVIFTSSRFSQKARDMAQKYAIILVNGDRLRRLLDRYFGTAN